MEKIVDDGLVSVLRGSKTSGLNRNHPLVMKRNQTLVLLKLFIGVLLGTALAVGHHAYCSILNHRLVDNRPHRKTIAQAAGNAFSNLFAIGVGFSGAIALTHIVSLCKPSSWRS